MRGRRVVIEGKRVMLITLDVFFSLVWTRELWAWGVALGCAWGVALGCAAGRKLVGILVIRKSFHGSDGSFHGSFHELPPKMHMRFPTRAQRLSPQLKKTAGHMSFSPEA